MDGEYASVIEIAEAIRTRRVSPVDVVEGALRRIDALNPALNAFVHVAPESALSEARASEDRVRRGEGGVLDGVPIAIKDDTVVAGMPTTEASSTAGGGVTGIDAHLVKRLREAGAIVVGKTNLPEFGATAVTESQRWGAARNPWSPEHTTGGSSGGSAAAVCAGLVPAGHGTDGGGSLRIPASCCGVFTVKPTRGRLSNAPYGSESPLTAHGFLTRTVADNALLLDVAAGSCDGDPFWLPPAATRFLDDVRAAGSRPPLRIAWTADPPIGMPVDPACIDAVRAAADVCATLGHHVEERTPDWHDARARDDFVDVWTVLIGAFVQYLVDNGGDPALCEPHNRAMYEQGRTFSATRYINVMAKLRQVARRALAAWQTYDIVLTPTLAKPPLRIGELFAAPERDIDPMLRAFEFVPFTPFANLTGQPAASIPFAFHDGLPVGVQAIGRVGDERTVLQLAAQLETAHPWAAVHPPLSAQPSAESGGPA